MKDTFKEAILWLGECTRAELFYTEGDQPNREQRFFNTFINVWLNRENAMDVQPTRDRVKSIENLRYWSGKPNQVSNSLSKQR